MIPSSASETAPAVATLVVRLWRAGPPHQPQPVRYQATHVQTGDVAYFASLKGVMHHVQHLADQLLASQAGPPPIHILPRHGDE